MAHILHRVSASYCSLLQSSLASKVNNKQNGDKAFAYSHTASQSESIDGAIKTGLVTAGNQSDIGILKVYVPNNAIILLAYIGSGNTFSALGIMCGAATGTIQSIEYKVNVYYYRYNFSGEITSS